MLKSMTGYGRAGFTLDGEGYVVEVKTLNHRYLDLKARLPERFFPLESRVREEVKRRFSRGHVTIQVRPSQGAGAAFSLNMPLVRAYLEAADRLRDELGIDGAVDVPFLLRIKEVLGAGEEGDSERDWRVFSEGLGRALDEVDAWRRREGGDLAVHIGAGIKRLDALMKEIERLAPESFEAHRKRLSDELARLVGENVDETRLIQEAALLAQKAAVDEEIARYRSHLNQFSRYMDSDEPVGKRLDFLCQEILREANTIASKSPDVRIVQAVVEIKSELEKLREQVQNIE
ncbi:MAG TPA: YicC family protein [Deltaproteobacteria bacterium]|nr:YicC family protein [Deltaproteobacteria bacterium]